MKISKKIIKNKRGRPKIVKAPKKKRPRGRPRNPPMTTAMLETKLLDMLKQYRHDHGIVTEEIDKVLEPYCVSDLMNSL